MMTWMLGGLMVGLVALYLVRPPIRQRKLSAARFFVQLPEPRRNLGRLGIRQILKSPLFWLQLLVLALLWWTLYGAELYGTTGPRSIGVWLAIDTSASMTTLQDQDSRMVKAKSVALQAIRSSSEATQGGSWCARIAPFDLAFHDERDAGDSASAIAAINALSPRVLGTDLDMLRRATMTRLDQDAEQCQISHVVVVSDRPAPVWLSDIPVSVIWQDVSQPVVNVGLTLIRPIRNQLSGEIREIQYEVSAFGAPSTDTTLTIQGPGGTNVTEKLSWTNRRIFQGRFAPKGPGLYTLKLSPDSVYTFDDTATIEVQAAEPLRLNWQLPDRSLFDALGWIQDDKSPLLHVVSATNLLSDTNVPMLIVGAGYGSDGTDQPIGYFDESSALLDDLNLDVAERVGIQGIDGTASLPSGFEPMLQGSDNRVWIASRATPPGVYIPGLPTATDDNAGSFSQTVFFNALRTLLVQRRFPELYSLTTAADVEPEGTRLALHPGEGDTSGEPRSAGRLDDWRSATRNQRQRSWPLWLVCAIAVFLVERTIAVLRGDRDAAL